MAETEELRNLDNYHRAFSVTPSDSSDLAVSADALFVGGAGDVQVDTVNGDNVTFTGLSAGQVLPVKVARVYSTNTTATEIIGLVT